MKTYPRRPEQFKARCNELIDRASTPSTRIMLKIPPIAVMQFEMLVESYYGGPVKAGMALIRKGMASGFREIKWNILIKITDAIGWTKVYHMPETATHHEYWHRHGYRCSGSPNCNDIKCIEKSLPTWFKWITRWEENDL